MLSCTPEKREQGTVVYNLKYHLLFLILQIHRKLIKHIKCILEGKDVGISDLSGLVGTGEPRDNHRPCKTIASFKHSKK